MELRSVDSPTDLNNHPHIFNMIRIFNDNRDDTVKLIERMLSYHDYLPVPLQILKIDNVPQTLSYSEISGSY